jgi:hypothetical protein
MQKKRAFFNPFGPNCITHSFKMQAFFIYWKEALIPEVHCAIKRFETALFKLDSMRDIMKPFNFARISPKKNIKISTLSNATHYFLDRALIVCDKKGFRLMVIHRRKLLTDKRYGTAKGAKVAFANLFQYKAWREFIKPIWTPFYDPDSQWPGNMLSAKGVKG